jgi:hypothetical protein
MSFHQETCTQLTWTRDSDDTRPRQEYRIYVQQHQLSIQMGPPVLKRSLNVLKPQDELRVPLSVDQPVPYDEGEYLMSRNATVRIGSEATISERLLSANSGHSSGVGHQAKFQLRQYRPPVVLCRTAARRKIALRT